MSFWPLVTQLLHHLHDLSGRSLPAAAGLYILAYTVMMAVCLPVGPPMSMVGGALFGLWGGTACAVAGITAGSQLLFLIARSTAGAALARRRASLIAAIQPQLARDGFAALLALRIAPVMPSWLLTLAAALAGMRTAPFVIATMLGVLPATIVFALTGAALGEADPTQGLRPDLLFALLGLSALVLAPVVLRWLRRREAPR